MLKALSSAKVNLTLDILGRDPKSGYHFLETIIYEVPELHDIITLQPADQDQVICAGIPQEENIAFKALQLFKKHHPTNQHFRIEITKNIPLRSGLGGGSSNAATTLKLLNQATNANLTTQTLSALAAGLGQDVPFFIHGGTAFCSGFGADVQPLPPLKLNLEIHALSAPQANKTAAAYAALDLAKCGQNRHLTEKLLLSFSPSLLLSFFHNDFSQLHNLPKNAFLSGSGPSWFK